VVPVPPATVQARVEDAVLFPGRLAGPLSYEATLDGGTPPLDLTLTGSDPYETLFLSTCLPRSIRLAASIWLHARVTPADSVSPGPWTTLTPVQVVPGASNLCRFGSPVSFRRAQAWFETRSSPPTGPATGSPPSTARITYFTATTAKPPPGRYLPSPPLLEVVSIDREWAMLDDGHGQRMRVWTRLLSTLPPPEAVREEFTRVCRAVAPSSSGWRYGGEFPWGVSADMGGLLAVLSATGKRERHRESTCLAWLSWWWHDDLNDWWTTSAWKGSKDAHDWTRGIAAWAVLQTVSNATILALARLPSSGESICLRSDGRIESTEVLFDAHRCCSRSVEELGTALRGYPRGRVYFVDEYNSDGSRKRHGYKSGLDAALRHGTGHPDARFLTDVVLPRFQRVAPRPAPVARGDLFRIFATPYGCMRDDPPEPPGSAPAGWTERQCAVGPETWWVHVPSRWVQATDHSLLTIRRVGTR
jgi:hypothetical protein